MQHSHRMINDLKQAVEETEWIILRVKNERTFQKKIKALPMLYVYNGYLVRETEYINNNLSHIANGKPNSRNIQQKK